MFRFNIKVYFWIFRKVQMHIFCMSSPRKCFCSFVITFRAKTLLHEESYILLNCASNFLSWRACFDGCSESDDECLLFCVYAVVSDGPAFDLLRVFGILINTTTIQKLPIFKINFLILLENWGRTKLNALKIIAHNE